jgi:hypothetical protein
MELLLGIKCYIATLSTQDVGSLISAAANVVMAAGVLLAAKSLRVQKNVHIIDTHERFQADIRRLQECMPPDINEGRIVFNSKERRQVQLYWYAVFDEWFTCKANNTSPEIHQLWTNFAWGAKSAIEHIPLFASELLKLKEAKPYLLGTHGRFFDEIEEFIRTQRSPVQLKEDRKRRFVFLYGVPCSGKSSVLLQLEKMGWDCLKIDDIVRGQALIQAKGAQTLTRDSFVEHSDSVCLAVYARALQANATYTAVELGCLFPLMASRHIKGMLALLDIDVLDFHLEISEACAMQRAVARNESIASGLTDAVPIDDAGKMFPFFASLHTNLPDKTIALPAEHLDPVSLSSRIIAEAKLS